MKFNLSITLGNAAMITPNDIARALQDLASRIEDGYEPATPTVITHRVYDQNGNECGYWRVE